MHRNQNKRLRTSDERGVLATSLFKLLEKRPADGLLSENMLTFKDLIIYMLIYYYKTCT